MAMNVTLTDAAHKYGLDGFYLGAPSGAGTALGTVLDTTTSYGNGVPVVNMPSTIAVTYSSGLKLVYAFRATSSSAGTLTSVTGTSAATGETVFTATGSVTINTVSTSAVLQASGILATGDTFTGNGFDNTFQGFAGNDVINGGDGIDTALFSGPRSAYTVTSTATGFVVQGRDGIDTLNSVERLKFDDLNIGTDTNGATGQAYRLYQAAFNRTPDTGGLGYQIHMLEIGTPLHTVAQTFIDSPEFKTTYGTLSNTQYVTQLYANVLHRAPDAPGLQYHLGTLAQGADRASVLLTFSESQENQAQLVGTIAAGVTYSYTG